MIRLLVRMILLFMIGQGMGITLTVQEAAQALTQMQSWKVHMIMVVAIILSAIQAINWIYLNI